MKVRLPRWAKIALEAAAPALLAVLFVLDRDEVLTRLHRITPRTVLGVAAFQLALPGLASAQGMERRRSESNRCIKVLQTSPLPLGYGARRCRIPPSGQNGGEPLRM